MERAVIGTAEQVEAEYGVRCAAPFCLALHFDGEFYSSEGFETLKAAVESAKDGGFVKSQIEVLG